MIVAISIDKEFNSISELNKALEEIKKMPNFSGFISIKSNFLDMSKHPYTSIDIDWNDFSGESIVKLNKFGKKFNSNAPANAAKKVVDQATHIIEFGKGDYNINRLAKDKLTQLILQKSETGSKYFKF